MIGFKTFLAESRSAPLYHATFLHNANKILDDNTLVGSVQYAGGQAKNMGKVIFVTRSFKHARYLYGGKGMAVFQLDQNKLKNRYKIRPIKNWPDYRQKNHKPSYMVDRLGGNEFEEVIIADKIANISDYITTIYVDSKVDKDKYPHVFASDKVTFI